MHYKIYKERISLYTSKNTCNTCKQHALKICKESIFYHTWNCSCNMQETYILFSIHVHAIPHTNNQQTCIRKYARNVYCIIHEMIYANNMQTCMRCKIWKKRIFNYTYNYTCNKKCKHYTNLHYKICKERICRCTCNKTCNYTCNTTCKQCVSLYYKICTKRICRYTCHYTCNTTRKKTRMFKICKERIIRCTCNKGSKKPWCKHALQNVQGTYILSTCNYAVNTTCIQYANMHYNITKYTKDVYAGLNAIIYAIRHANYMQTCIKKW